MEKKDLKPWLKNQERDYKQGLDLFVNLKVDPKKNAFFQTDEPSALHQNMLFQALSSYDRVYNKESKTDQEKPKQTLAVKTTTASKNLKVSLTEAANVDTAISSGRVIIDKNNRINYDDLTPELKAAYDENGKHYSEIKSLHAKMKAVLEDASNDPERKELVNLMLDKQKVIQGNWAKLDAAYPADGSEPKKPVGFMQPTKATGALSKAEIEQIEDAVIREKSKDMRIDTNLKYIRTNRGDDKKVEKIQERMDELVAWEIDYEERIGKNTTAQGEQ